MRTAEHLLGELRDETESQKFSDALLLCSFEDHSERVWNLSPDKLRELNDIVRRGGKPIAMIGFTIHVDGILVYSRLLKEFTGQDWAVNFVQANLEEFRRFLEQRYEAVGGATFDATVEAALERSVEAWTVRTLPIGEWPQ